MVMLLYSGHVSDHVRKSLGSLVDRSWTSSDDSEREFHAYLVNLATDDDE